MSGYYSWMCSDIPKEATGSIQTALNKMHCAFSVSSVSSVSSASSVSHHSEMKTRPPQRGPAAQWENSQADHSLKFAQRAIILGVSRIDNACMALSRCPRQDREPDAAEWQFGFANNHAKMSCNTCPCTSVRRLSMPLW